MVAALSPALSPALARSDLDETIRVRLQTLSPLAATIAKDPRRTLVPSSDAAPHSGKTALEALRRIQRDPGALHIEDKLGEGGMGIVHTGRQVALGRRVAVKTLRTEHVCDENVEGLLGEAWLVGSLEHPNVIPVYDLGLDETGAPLLVMKRIEGDTWADLLADPKATQRHAHESDPLEFHLRVLVQVANAVHFAHSRNVIHRDLKPDNVMVGDFGEVYVLDWGVATRPGPVRHVAGTIVYMAPEMLGGMGDLTERTDVYLIGAMLHEVLTGHPPHEGPTMEAMVSSIVLSAPRLPEDVPEELADLVGRCMSRDPAKRPESALAVRRAIELFLEHRGAMALAAEADERLSELMKLLAAEDVPVDRVYNVFGACRFGFKQALRAWKDSTVAAEGLRRAQSAMIRYEADRGEARAAALLLGELEERDPELEALVAAAQKRAEQEAKKIEKLRELERDLDPREGRRLRLGAGLLFAGLWTIVPLLAPYALAGHPEREGLVIVPVDVVCLLAIVLGNLLFPIKTLINRQLLWGFAFGVGSQALVIPAARYLMDVPPPFLLPLSAVYWFIVMGVITVTVERRLFPLPIGYAAAAVAMRFYPDLRYPLVAAANVLAVITVAVIWSQRATERAIEREKLRKETGSCH